MLFRSMDAAVTGISNKRRPLDRLNRIARGCTTCMAMSGSGLRIAGTRTTTLRRPTDQRGSGQRPELPYRPRRFLAQRERVRPCGCPLQAPCQCPVRHARLPGGQNVSALISRFAVQANTTARPNHRTWRRIGAIRHMQRLSWLKCEVAPLLRFGCSWGQLRRAILTHFRLQH